MDKKKILIIDDDPHITELLCLYLHKENFSTSVCHDGSHALNEFNIFKPDLVLLDIMLPLVNGFDICQSIRSLNTTPIIMLSARGEASDKINGLQIGADDYIEKPFDVYEVLARIHAVMRRSSVSDSSTNTNISTQLAENSEKVIHYDGLYINFTQFKVEYIGTPVDMPPKELELLYLLSSSPNHIFTRKELLTKIWGYEYIGDSRTVDVHIKRIRSKIKDYKNWKIVTVWGRGYKFEVCDEN